MECDIYDGYVRFSMTTPWKKNINSYSLLHLNFVF